MICSDKLAGSCSPVEASRNQMRRAAVTVTMFTGLFLLCNSPYFINMILEAVTIGVFSYPGPIFSSRFMFWYSWPVSKVLFTVLNAALDPVLYYCRVAGLKCWFSGLIGKLKNRSYRQVKRHLTLVNETEL